MRRSYFDVNVSRLVEDTTAEIATTIVWGMALRYLKQFRQLITCFHCCHPRQTVPGQGNFQSLSIQLPTIVHRKIDMKPCILTRLTLNRQFTPMLPNNSIGDGKPQTGSDSPLLG